MNNLLHGLKPGYRGIIDSLYEENDAFLRIFLQELEDCGASMLCACLTSARAVAISPPGKTSRQSSLSESMRYPLM
jgi:hypothetical protein